MTGIIYSISAIISRFDFVFEYFSSDIVIIAIVSIVYEFGYTDGPRYIQSFYLQFRVYAIQKWPFSGTYPLINGHPWSFYIRICYM